MKVYITETIIRNVIEHFYGEYCDAYHQIHPDIEWQVLNRSPRLLTPNNVLPRLYISELVDEWGYVITIVDQYKFYMDIIPSVIDRYVIKITSTDIIFRFNTDYFESCKYDEDWLNMMYRIYTKLVEANIFMHREEIYQQSRQDGDINGRETQTTQDQETGSRHD